MATLAIGAAKFLFNRYEKKKGGSTTQPKQKMSSVNKLRIALLIPAAVSGVLLILSMLLIFAGSKPGNMESYSVFTLNVSRIGEGIHGKVNGAIDGIKVDDLHIDLKRSAPLIDIPATITPAPTTMITMAPRDVGSVFDSLTDKAGDGIESAKSAGESKASQVKSKASSAANSVESGVNSGINNAAKKLKAKLKEVVDDSFKHITEALDLKDFYSIHLMSTCEGSYEKKKDEIIPTQKKIDLCKKTSALNPMKWVSIFYWAGAILVALAFVLNTWVVWKPASRMMKWVLLSLGGAFATFTIGSGVSHLLAKGSTEVINFIGETISVNAIPGKNFIGMTWAITFMTLGNAAILFMLHKWAKRHPQVAGSSKSHELPAISRPIANEAPSDGHQSYGMDEFVGRGRTIRRDRREEEANGRVSRLYAAPDYAASPYAHEQPAPAAYRGMPVPPAPPVPTRDTYGSSRRPQTTASSYYEEDHRL